MMTGLSDGLSWRGQIPGCEGKGERTEGTAPSEKGSIGWSHALAREAGEQLPPAR